MHETCTRPGHHVRRSRPHRLDETVGLETKEKDPALWLVCLPLGPELGSISWVLGSTKIGEKIK